MNGLNDRFKKRPKKFLREMVIQETAALLKANPPEGLYDFDFEPADAPTIALFGTARPGVDPGEEFITAYWLPWKSRSTLELELGADAKYFFTSHLGGCELRIIPPAGVGTRTKILHIAGDTGGKRGHGPGGIEWRAKQAADALTPSEWHRSRSFSSTDPYPTGYAGATDVQVIGFKKDYWELWAQETGEDFTKVSRCWRIY
jgi:hypothetical protein